MVARPERGPAAPRNLAARRLLPSPARPSHLPSCRSVGRAHHPQRDRDVLDTTLAAAMRDLLYPLQVAIHRCVGDEANRR